MDDLALVFILTVIFAIVTGVVGKDTSLGWGGSFLLGLFFPIIGFIIVSCLPSKEEDKKIIAIDINRSVDDLVKLSELYSKGFITKEEFDIQKQKYLK